MDRQWNDDQPIYRQLRDRVVAMILTACSRKAIHCPRCASSLIRMMNHYDGSVAWMLCPMRRKSRESTIDEKAATACSRRLKIAVVSAMTWLRFTAALFSVALSLPAGVCSSPSNSAPLTGRVVDAANALDEGSKDLI